MDKAEIDRENTKRNRDREQAILQGDSEIAEAWFDQAAEYWKQAIALTPGNYIEAQNWKVDLAGLFDLKIILSTEPEVKIAVDWDPIKTSFEEWARPGHFSRTIAKGPDTTTWIWNYIHTGVLEEISRKGLYGMYFHGARFSNYEAWLSDPTHIGPSAQIPLPHEFILNRDLLAQLYPSFAEGATPFFTLNWSKYAEFLSFRGGLDPITGGLWVSDIAHHHLAIAILS
ncbi:hypothetical protein ACJX0J_004906 [Zea mays]